MTITVCIRKLIMMQKSEPWLQDPRKLDMCTGQLMTCSRVAEQRQEVGENVSDSVTVRM